MGLDVRAYKNLVKTSKNIYNDEGYFLMVVSQDCFNRAMPFKDGEKYETEEKPFHFRAGSYSGYNLFRKQLCFLCFCCLPEKVWENPQKYEGKPFYELINFSDCKGTIGNEVCKKLYLDFVNNKEILSSVDDDYFQETYNNFLTAFEIASNNGAVDFG